MKINFTNFPQEFKLLKKELIKKFVHLGNKGEYVLGNELYQFEKNIENYLNVKHVVGVGNWTEGMIMLLKALNFKKGDEIIIPNLTYPATANAVMLAGGKPVLVDVDKKNLLINEINLLQKITKKTKAIMVVHQFGHSADMDPIMKIARKYNLRVIEDNAESIGGKYKGKKLGSIGDLATLSFYANKIITSGEGGAILTNSKKIAEKCYVLRDHGMSRTSHPIKRYTHIELGFNYRMTNMQAAVGFSQLEIINKMLKKRNAQMLLYKKYLSQISEIKVRSFKSWCSPVHWLTTISILKKNSRNKLIQFLLKSGVDARPMINPVHQAYHFKKYFKGINFKNSINISKNSLHLPSSTYLSSKQIKFICNKVKLFFHKKH